MTEQANTQQRIRQLTNTLLADYEKGRVVDKKNHFDDNQWMMNRAIEYYTTFDAEKYIDIFANVYNTL